MLHDEGNDQLLSEINTELEYDLYHAIDKLCLVLSHNIFKEKDAVILQMAVRLMHQQISGETNEINYK